MSRRCLIISGGDFTPVPDPQPDDFIIACDKGYSYCERLGLKPDLMISDFDSFSGPVSENVPVLDFPSEKDDTDTMLAIRWAYENRFDEICLYCALGGRLDHTIANMQSLVFARKHGMRAGIYSTDEIILALMDEKISLPRREGWSLSVFAVDTACSGVTLHGTKYLLENAVLTPAFPLGISNQWAAPEAEISVRDGVLLIIQSKM